jgi:hypothetical protein
LILIVLLFVAGCGSSVDSDGKDVASPTTEVAASPTPEPVFDSPLESPLLPTPSPVASCLDLIETSGNTICGFVQNQSDGKPIAGRPIYLAEALLSDEGLHVFAALDQESAPQGTTDENGMFFVVDVPPSMYFLMIGEYPRPLMLREPDRPENDLYVDWREEGVMGPEIDLGIIPVSGLQAP